MHDMAGWGMPRLISHSSSYMGKASGAAVESCAGLIRGRHGPVGSREGPW
jgi:hypothetical protein